MRLPLIGFGPDFGLILERGQFVFDGNPDLELLALLEPGALLGCGIDRRVAAHRSAVARPETRERGRRRRPALP